MGFIRACLKDDERPFGYTIVEIMIVVAISGLMFVIAAQFISGKEERTAFTAGTNSFVAQLQSIVAEVIDGQYKDLASFTCSVSGGSLTFGNSVSGGQGSNAPCVFLGKFIHFPEPANPTHYEVFSLAAARDQTQLASADITPIVTPDDFTQQATMPQSLQVLSVKVTDSSGATHTTYGVGFTQSLGVTGTGNAQTVGLVYSTGLASSDTLESAAASKLDSTNIVDATSAVICVTDATRYAEVMIGTNSGTNNANTAPNVSLQVVPVCS